MTTTTADPVEVVIRRRANQALAAILDVKDDIGYLTEEDAVDLRRVVLDEVNELVDLCLQLIRSLGIDQGMFVNLEIVEKLDAIHRAVVH